MIKLQHDGRLINEVVHFFRCGDICAAVQGIKSTVQSLAHNLSWNGNWRVSLSEPQTNKLADTSFLYIRIIYTFSTHVTYMCTCKYLALRLHRVVHRHLEYIALPHSNGKFLDARPTSPS